MSAPAELSVPNAMPGTGASVAPPGTNRRMDAATRPTPHRSVARGWWRPSLWLPTVVALAIAATLWTLVANSNPYILPQLGAVGQQLVTKPLFFLTNAGTTLQEALLGLLIGFASAFIIGVLVSESVILRRAIMPLAVVLNVTPVVAIAPALVVAFGFGPMPKLIVTALITFFPVLMNVTVGLRSVSPAVLHVFSTLDANRAEVLWRLRIPSALPYIFAALRVVFPLSIVGAVVAEFSAPGAAAGLGTVISVASSNSALPVVFAAIACLAIMGALLLLVITLVERRVLSWHESQQSAR